MTVLTETQKEHLKDLVDALRSGEYDQTKGALRNSNGFCCLGVACDLFDKSLWVFDHTDKVDLFRFLTNATFLPIDVQEYFGLNLTGELVSPVEFKDCEIYSLLNLNDDGMVFTEIADIIENQFL